MHSETLFSMALGLHTPWQIKDVTFSSDEKLRSELHLRIDFVSGSRFLYEKGNLCPVHDIVERQNHTRYDPKRYFLLRYQIPVDHKTNPSANLFI